MRFEVENPSGQYPGRTYVVEQAEMMCVPALEELIAANRVPNSNDYNIFSLLPDGDTWQAGTQGRFAVCLAHRGVPESGRKFSTEAPTELEAESGAAAGS